MTGKKKPITVCRGLFLSGRVTFFGVYFFTLVPQSGHAEAFCGSSFPQCLQNIFFAPFLPEGSDRENFPDDYITAPFRNSNFCRAFPISLKKPKAERAARGVRFSVRV